MPALERAGGGRASIKRAKERRQGSGATKSPLIFPIPFPFRTGPALLRVVPEQKAPRDRGGWERGRAV